MKEKIASTRISEKLYNEMLSTMQEMGFKSVTEFLTALISMSVTQWQRIKDRRAGKQQEPDEIDEMFRELEDWQAPKYGNRCKQTKTPLTDKTKI